MKKNLSAHVCRKDTDKHLHDRWIKLNERIKAVGLEQYYDETKDKPRYV